MTAVDASVMPNDDRDTRYGHDAGTGANEPKRHERKEQRPGWKPPQGGDQTRDDRARHDHGRDGARAEEVRLEPPIDPAEREKVR